MKFVFLPPPNTGRVRTRLEKVSDDFTQKLRAAIQEAAAKTIEAHQGCISCFGSTKSIRHGSCRRDQVFRISQRRCTQRDQVISSLSIVSPQKKHLKKGFPLKRPKTQNLLNPPARNQKRKPKPHPPKGKPALDEFDD